MDSAANDFADELNDEYRKAQADWRDIKTAAAKEVAVATGGAIVAGGFHPLFAIPGYGIALIAELLAARAKAMLHSL